jgi:uncharacterized protein YycO
MRLCLHQGKGFVSSAIRWQTRSKYSHASLLFGDGLVIEAREFIGVHATKLLPRQGEAIEIFEVQATARQESVMRHYALSQVGKPYDYISIARFLTREPVREWQRNDWFCSELAFETFRIAEIHLLQNIAAWAVNPGMLSLSPLLRWKDTIRANRK